MSEDSPSVLEQYFLPLQVWKHVLVKIQTRQEKACACENTAFKFYFLSYFLNESFCRRKKSLSGYKLATGSMSKEDSYFRLAVTNHSENYSENKKQHCPQYCNTGIEKIIQLELLLFTERKRTDFSSPTSASVNILDTNNMSNRHPFSVCLLPIWFHQKLKK